MESILNLLSTGFSYIRTIGLADAVDILIVAYLIYKVINIVRKTNSRNVARGIFLLIIDHGDAFRCKSRDHKRRTGSQVRRADTGSREFIHSGDGNGNRTVRSGL